MTTRADEIKAEIGKLAADISSAKRERDARAKRLQLLDEYINQKEKRLIQAMAQLEREDTILRKPQPVGVKLDGYDI